MPEILFVKSGEHEQPVTKVLEKNSRDTKSLIKNKKLEFLGVELSPLGVASRMTDFTGPDHVVLKLSVLEAEELEGINPGFHLVHELSPSEVA